MKKILKAKAPKRKSFATAALIAATISALHLMSPWVFPVRGQIPPLPQVVRQYDGQFDIRSVWLDGYRLFYIAAPEINIQEKTQDAPTPVKLRAQSIERRLYNIVNSNFDPKTLQLTYRMVNGHTVIYCQDGEQLQEQAVMTVTDLDAELAVGDSSSRADELTKILKDALIRAHQERQPSFLQRQMLPMTGVILTVAVSSWGITFLRRRLKKQSFNLVEQPSMELVSPKNTRERLQVGSLAATRLRINQKLQLDLNQLQRRLLLVGQLVILGSGIWVIFGFLPYTRWLQPLLFSAPLKVFGVGLVTYVVLQLNNVLIDRFFSALKEEELLESRASQRLVLRIFTSSRVLKSVTKLVAVSLGTLVTLLMLEVDVVPLLAGAGVFALSISLACQHIIRDLVNGLMILLEDQYAVGDVILVGETKGVVEYMNLHITQLRNDEGRLISIPHGAIAVVENLSKEWSRVDVTIDLPLDTPVEPALAVIKQLAQQLYSEPEWRKRILEPPEVLGIDKIDRAGILIRIWIKTKPLEQSNVAREFRLRLKRAFEQKNFSTDALQQSLELSNSLQFGNSKP